MKLARYLYKNQISFGQVINNKIYDLSDVSDNIISFLQKNHTYNVEDKKKKVIIKLEDVKILRPGYAIEYDYVDPRELTNILETKKAK